MLEKIEIKKMETPVCGYNYNAQVWRSDDGGRSWWYTGNGKYFRTIEEAKNYTGK